MAVFVFVALYRIFVVYGQLLTFEISHMNVEIVLVIIAIIILYFAIDRKIQKLGNDIGLIKEALNKMLSNESKVAGEQPKIVAPPIVAEQVAHVPVPPPFVAREPEMEVSHQSPATSAKDGEMPPISVLNNPVPTPPPFHQAPPSHPKNNAFEKWIGENLFGKLGILILVLGIGFFVKYAIDKSWINELLRVVMGFLAGGGLLGIAYRLRNRYRAYSSLLAGGAFATFFITDSIACHNYFLYPLSVAFIILILATVGMTVIAIVYDRRELAAIALVGGFLAPFLVSSDHSSPWVMLVYFTVLNMGMMVISSFRRWSELNVIAILVTWPVFGFTFLFGNIAELLTVFCLVAANFLIFIVSSHLLIKRATGAKTVVSLVIAAIVNDISFLCIGEERLLCMDLGIELGGALCLCIALVHALLLVAVWRKRTSMVLLVNHHIALVVALTAMAVPIQFDGNVVALGWSAEAAILTWFFVKSRGKRVYEVAVLFVLLASALAFLFNLSGMLHLGGNEKRLFLNTWFMTALFTSLATLVVALITEKHREFFALKAKILSVPAFSVITHIVGFAMLYATFMADFANALQGQLCDATMAMFSTLFFLLCSVYASKKMNLMTYRWLFLLALLASVVSYMSNILRNQGAVGGSLQVVFQWLTALFVIVLALFMVRKFAKFNVRKRDFTITWSLAVVLVWITMVRQLLWQLGIGNFLAGFSVSLGIAAFALMIQGMRLHYKDLRVLSLVAFGVIIGKLVFIDLWTMPPIGKIITFICLGVLMLMLSFMYQRLKDVLFGKDAPQREMKTPDMKQ